MRSRALAVVFAVALVTFTSFVVAFYAHGQTKPIELSYSSFFPATYALGQSATDWAKEVEKRSNGRVKITLHHSGTLTGPTTCYEGVVNGISDIGQSVLSYTRGRFPLMEVLDLPGYPLSAQVTTKVCDEFYKKFKPKEFADTHVLYMHAHIPGTIATVNKPIRSLEDLKGLKIRTTGLAT